MEKTYIIDALRKCYDANYGVVAAARRVKVDFQIARKYYEQFATEPRGATVSLGEPPPERSALATFKPWTPEYNDKPVVVKQQKAPWEDKKPEPQPLPPKPVTDRRFRSKGPMPTSADIGLVLIIVAKFMDIDPSLLATRMRDGGRHGPKISDARVYSFLLLERLYPNTAKAAIASCLGVSHGSTNTFGPNIYFRMRNNKLPGYNQADFDLMLADLKAKNWKQHEPA